VTLSAASATLHSISATEGKLALQGLADDLLGADLLDADLLDADGVHFAPTCN